MSAETAHDLAADINREKKFASEYREQKDEVDADHITEVTIQHHTLDITYFTKRGSKTVRCRGAMGPASYNDLPEGFYSFWHDGKQYAYSPDEVRLITVNNEQNQTVAEGDDIYKFEMIGYPTRAVVKGSIDTDVQATIYYRSPRSDDMQSVTVKVNYMESRAAEITGKEVGTGRRIEALTRWERDIVSKHGTNERTLGKVTRVEFPRGQKFTIEVEGLGENKGGNRGEELIEKRVKKAFRNSDSVNVTHEGQLEWE